MGRRIPSILANAVDPTGVDDDAPASPCPENDIGTNAATLPGYRYRRIVGYTVSPASLVVAGGGLRRDLHASYQGRTCR